MNKLGIAAALFGFVSTVSLATAAPLASRPADSCGTVQVRPTGVVPTPYAGTGQRVLYLNRFGGKYTLANGATNSATNTANASIVSQIGPATITIPPMEAGFDWPTVRDCVVAAYKPFNVRVVETEPKAGTYVEAVVGGYGTELGFGADQLFGIASADNFCSVTESGIAFSFSHTHQGVQQKDKELCATIAHEVGHLLALEHEILAADMLSYVLVADSPPKSFVNQNVQCGTTPQQIGQCSCSSGTTNSASRLNQFVGARAAETNAPSLTVVSPGNNGKIAPAFEVVAKATDGEGMADVLVYIDGNEVGNDSVPEGDTYKVSGSGIAEGAHTLTVVARDLAGNLTKKDLSVTIAKLDIGETCVANDACKGNICAMSTDGNFCTQSCTVANDTCPDGFACDATLSICVGNDSGGCCSVGNDSNAGIIAMLTSFGVGLVLMRRRRRA